ncbi:adenylate/guanylate cyclase domain-containing protein [Paraburkholderia youngii]|uniref:adenylate/guanylate cyclase domain-containing protein n=1 Tax=Paraburkholderia youngii TaxID=2782701 RepID=UPI003D1DE74A
MLAIFGLSCEPSTACRQALGAVPLVAANIEEINAALEQQLQTKIRFGIGLHCGRAVMGEIGFREHVTFTAIGDSLNVASRLEQLTKEVGCEAIVSEQVFEHARVSAAGLPQIAARLRGRDVVVPVRVVSKAAQMPRH